MVELEEISLSDTTLPKVRPVGGIRTQSIREARQIRLAHRYDRTTKNGGVTITIIK